MSLETSAGRSRGHRGAGCSPQLPPAAPEPRGLAEPRSPGPASLCHSTSQRPVQPLTHQVAPAWSPRASPCWRLGLAGAGGEETSILLRGGADPAENRKRAQFGPEPTPPGTELIGEEPHDAASTERVGVKAPSTASGGVSVRPSARAGPGEPLKYARGRKQDAEGSAIRFWVSDRRSARWRRALGARGGVRAGGRASRAPQGP